MNRQRIILVEGQHTGLVARTIVVFRMFAKLGHIRATGCGISSTKLSRITESFLLALTFIGKYSFLYFESAV